MRTKDTEKMIRLEDYIDEYTDEHGHSPSVKEMAEGTGLSAATVSRYLSYMRECGILDYSGKRNITTSRQLKKISETIEVPVLGDVSCGLPKFADSNIEEYVRLPVSLFGRGDYYILRANGNSMIDADIEDGDLVLIRSQDYALPGQKVIALIDDEATLKTYYPEPENNRVRLHPENDDLDDIYVDECIIQGVAAMVMKNLE